jgi:hypothetical protein
MYCFGVNFSGRQYYVVANNVDEAVQHVREERKFGPEERLTEAFVFSSRESFVDEISKMTPFISDKEYVNERKQDAEAKIDGAQGPMIIDYCVPSSGGA